jgi:SAM-dependent methyltransferase
MSSSVEENRPSTSFLRRCYLLLGQPNYLRWLQFPAIRKLVLRDRRAVILDIGCGPMLYASRLMRQAGSVIAIDYTISSDAKSISKRLGIPLLQADAQSLPVRSASVDCILASSIVHMLPQPLAMLRECRRVLTGNGIIVLSVPNEYILIPRLYHSAMGRTLCRLISGVRSYETLIETLNDKFGVKGPQGYYSLSSIKELLDQAGLTLNEHRYVPGPLGSYIWELGGLAFVRFGAFALHSLFAFYPLARLLDSVLPARRGSEHLILATAKND